MDLRREGPRLCDSDAALLALAQALVRWNRSNAYSTATGEPMKAIQGGHARYGRQCLDEQRSGVAAAACSSLSSQCLLRHLVAACDMLSSPS